MQATSVKFDAFPTAAMMLNCDWVSTSRCTMFQLMFVTIRAKRIPTATKTMPAFARLMKRRCQVRRLQQTILTCMTSASIMDEVSKKDITSVVEEIPFAWLRSW